jgi:hypothetical protein
MFSFKSLAVFSTLAFGAISSVAAAPLESGNNVLARCGCSSAAGVVTDLTASLTVHVSELSTYLVLILRLGTYSLHVSQSSSLRATARST